jgi:23S rRNA (pseudouridine1915-N3)-methyltransferase
VKIELVAVDKLRSGWAREGVAEYLGRIARYAPAVRSEVKAARGEGSAAAVEEGERILRAAAIAPRDRLVALAPGAEALDSRGWAALLERWAAEGVARVVFAVGGATGLAPAVLAAAHRTVGLGPQTLSHELAQLVLCEQIYRAWTLLKGEPYHK